MIHPIWMYSYIYPPFLRVLPQVEVRMPFAHYLMIQTQPNASMTSGHDSHAEQDLVDGLRNGDNGVIARIYSMYFSGIRRWISKNSGSTDDARDIFQEGLLAMYNKSKRHGLTLNEPFGAYLFRSCKWLWLKELRKRRREQATIRQSRVLMDKELVGDEQAELDRQREQFLQQCFDQLGTLCQQVLKLSWQGLNLKIISHQLGKSYGYLRRKRPECIAQLVELYKLHNAHLNK